MSAILGKLAQVMGSQKLFETGAVYAVNVSTGPARGRTSGLASALVVDEKTEDGKAWLAKLTEKDQTGELEVAWSPRPASALARSSASLWPPNATSPGTGRSWPRRPCQK